MIVTNPLVQEIQPLPPIPKKKFKNKVAELVFGNSTKTYYFLYVVGLLVKDLDVGDSSNDNKIIVLAIYCSKERKWVYFDYRTNACPPPSSMGWSNIVVQGYHIYYIGMQITEIPKDENFGGIPSIFYFNISPQFKQCRAFNFTSAGSQYGVEVVKCPKIVEVVLINSDTTNRKIYAISQCLHTERNYMSFFIIEKIKKYLYPLEYINHSSMVLCHNLYVIHFQCKILNKHLFYGKLLHVVKS